jgi:hypothetical protein
MPEPTPAARVHRDILAQLRAPASVDGADLSLAAAALPSEQRQELIERLAARREAMESEIVRVPGDGLFGGRRSLEDWRAEMTRITALQRALGAPPEVARRTAVEQLDAEVCGCITQWNPEVGMLVRLWLPADAQPLWDKERTASERKFAIAFWSFPYRQEEAARPFLDALADLRADASLTRVLKTLGSTRGVPKPLASDPALEIKSPDTASTLLGLLKTAWKWATTDRFQLPARTNGRISMIKPLERRRGIQG